MTEFPFTWQLGPTNIYHQTNNSIRKLNAEWSMECFWSNSECPIILEIRRKSKADDILVSGTLKLMRNSECVFERKFIQLIAASFETTRVDLEYSKVQYSMYTTYTISGVLTIPAYLSRKEYAKGAQIESLLKMSTDFECLLDPKATSFSDVNFICGTDSFPVHKNILSARSPVFASMFSTKMKETIDNKVDITDISPDILKRMLTYIYTGKIGELSYQFAGELLFAADKYQLQDLRRLCSNYLKSCISAENLLNILVLGYLYDQELKVFTMDFICNTCNELEVIEKTEEWKTLCQKSPDLVIDVLTRLVKSKEKK